MSAPDAIPDLRGTHHGRELRPLPWENGGDASMLKRISDRIVVAGAERVTFMRAEHAPTPGNFAAHAVDISGALAGVRKAAMAVDRFHTAAERVLAEHGYRLTDFLPPSKPADRRTIYVLGKPMHYFEIDGQLRLAKGESPWN
jgi:hypothetical protein